MAAGIEAATAGDGVGYRPRNYQLEMLEASMKENIIVAVCSSLADQPRC